MKKYSPLLFGALALGGAWLFWNSAERVDTQFSESVLSEVSSQSDVNNGDGFSVKPASSVVPEDRFSDAQVLDSTTEYFEDGTRRRVSVLDTGYKFHIQESLWESLAPDGEWTELRRSYVVADHLLVRLSEPAGESYAPVLGGWYRVPVAEASSAGALDRERVALMAAGIDALDIEEDGLMFASELPNDYPSEKRAGGFLSMHAEDGWSVRHDAEHVIVAVVDSGVNIDHEDLAENIWTNSGEIAGNGQDDDANGFVDDVHGYSYYLNSADVDDLEGHGSNMAGALGAVGNNSEGSTGVAWKVEIMPVNFLSEYGYGANSDAAKCIQYAANNGARVINMSWGGETDTSVIKTALQNAEAKGVVLVASAGNDSVNTDVVPNYPSVYSIDGLISVGAMEYTFWNQDNSTIKVASYSNRGEESVDVFAVGNLYELPAGWDNGSYKSCTGTSPAAALVSGVVALCIAEHPGLSPAEYRELIMLNSEYDSNLEGLCQSAGVVRLDRSLLNSGRDPVVISDGLVGGSYVGRSHVVLEVAFTAELPYHIQWYKDGALIDGENWNYLIIDAFSEADAGSYSVRIQNSVNVAQSGPVELTYEHSAPVIASQIKEANVVVGGELSLELELLGDEGQDYQWYRNGVAIDGAAEAKLLILGDDADASGSYVLRITNDLGVVESEPIEVTVIDGEFLGRWYSDKGIVDNLNLMKCLQFNGSYFGIEDGPYGGDDMFVSNNGIDWEIFNLGYGITDIALIGDQVVVVNALGLWVWDEVNRIPVAHPFSEDFNHSEACYILDMGDKAYLYSSNKSCVVVSTETFEEIERFTGDSVRGSPVVYDGSIYAYEGDTLFRSENMKDWEVMFTLPEESARYEKLFLAGGYLCAESTYSDKLWRSLDGETWEALVPLYDKEEEEILSLSLSYVNDFEGETLFKDRSNYLLFNADDFTLRYLGQVDSGDLLLPCEGGVVAPGLGICRYDEDGLLAEVDQYATYIYGEGYVDLSSRRFKILGEYQGLWYSMGDDCVYTSRDTRKWVKTSLAGAEASINLVLPWKDGFIYMRGSSGYGYFDINSWSISEIQLPSGYLGGNFVEYNNSLYFYSEASEEGHLISTVDLEHWSEVSSDVNGLIEGVVFRGDLYFSGYDGEVYRMNESGEVSLLGIYEYSYLAVVADSLMLYNANAMNFGGVTDQKAMFSTDGVNWEEKDFQGDPSGILNEVSNGLLVSCWSEVWFSSDGVDWAKIGYFGPEEISKGLNGSIGQFNGIGLCRSRNFKSESSIEHFWDQEDGETFQKSDRVSLSWSLPSGVEGVEWTFYLDGNALFSGVGSSGECSFIASEMGAHSAHVRYMLADGSDLFIPEIIINVNYGEWDPWVLDEEGEMYFEWKGQPYIVHERRKEGETTFLYDVYRFVDGSLQFFTTWDFEDTLSGGDLCGFGDYLYAFSYSRLQISVDGINWSAFDDIDIEGTAYSACGLEKNEDGLWVRSRLASGESCVNLRFFRDGSYETIYTPFYAESMLLFNGKYLAIRNSDEALCESTDGEEWDEYEDGLGRVEYVFKQDDKLYVYSSQRVFVYNSSDVMVDSRSLGYVGAVYHCGRLWFMRTIIENDFMYSDDGVNFDYYSEAENKVFWINSNYCVMYDRDGERWYRLPTVDYAVTSFESLNRYEGIVEIESMKVFWLSQGPLEADADRYRVSVYLSEDEEFSDDDIEMGSVDVVPDYGSEMHEAEIWAIFDSKVPSGLYHWLAVIDDGKITGDSDYGNNTYVSDIFRYENESELKVEELGAGTVDVTRLTTSSGRQLYEVVAVPVEGSRFVRWEGVDAGDSRANPLVIDIAQVRSLKAVFTEAFERDAVCYTFENDTVLLALIVDEAGKLQVLGGYADGSEAYRFLDLEKDLAGRYSWAIEGVGSFSFEMIGGVNDNGALLSDDAEGDWLLNPIEGGLEGWGFYFGSYREGEGIYETQTMFMPDGSLFVYLNGLESCLMTGSVESDYRFSSSSMDHELALTGLVYPEERSLRGKLDRSGTQYTWAALADTEPIFDRKLIGIATRGVCGAGDDRIIGGFFLDGDGPKRVVLRGIGPSLADAGLGGYMADPKITLYEGSTALGSNDNWQDSPAVEEIRLSRKQLLRDSEAAIVTTLDPGPYTVVMEDAAGQSGVALVEIYEYDPELGYTDATLTGIATRGLVEGGDRQLIGGFIIKTDQEERVLIRARGPSMADLVDGVLSDPKVEVYQGSTKLCEVNDLYDDASYPELEALYPRRIPSDTREVAFIMTLPAGGYTVIVGGEDGSSGIGIVEVYYLDR